MVDNSSSLCKHPVQPLDMVDNSMNLSKHASGWFFRHWTVWTGLCWLHKLSAVKIESFPLQFPGFLMIDMPME
jgi:hypothetical protein